VIEAYSGQKALEILRNGRKVQLMITDYAMPGMTGLQLAEEARRLRPGLPILLATGYADLPAENTLDLPRLNKPYQQRQLADQVAHLLG
jgi:CheY-like chemotaxis protein